MRGIVRAVAAAGAYVLLAGVPAMANPPLSAFAQLPAFDEPRLSPDGKHIAAIQGMGGHKAVTIYEVGAPPGTPPAVINENDWLIDHIQWAKNDRLAITLKHGAKALGDDRLRTWYREVTVSLRGDDAVVLLKNQSTLRNNIAVGGFTDIDLDDPDLAFVPLFQGGTGIYFTLNVLSVNVRTGEAHSLMVGTPDTTSWFMDGHGHVVARIDQTARPLQDHLKFYDGKEWHDGGTFDATTDHGAGFEGLTEDGKAVFSSWDDRSMNVLQTVDPSSPDKPAVLFSNPQYDLGWAIADEWTGRIIGAAYAGDREEYVYFDPRREALQRGLEQSFPDRSVTVVSADRAMDRVIVAVEGSRQPLTYYFLDRTTHKADLIASTYPDLTEADLGDMKPYPYKASDGLDIHAYLTLPPGAAAKNLPLVVLPHGGPNARDAIGFDWEAQFYVNRGYAVFQPNFRGSSGYGHKFVEAGFGQWGLKMQDDITDGVKKLIADGIADPKRICIVGGSYGGYAALAGAVFTPDLYACAVSFAGVSDLPEMVRTERRENGADSQDVSFWMSRLADDFDQRRDVSPDRHADRVKIPILLMHGEDDTTVHIDQSELMDRALKDAHKDVQFIRFSGEDHYFSLADTRLRYLSEVEKFLAAHIGSPSSAQK